MRLALLLALLLSPHGGAPHLVRFDSWVREGHLEVELLVDPRLYLRWADLRAEDPFALEPPELAAALEAAPAIAATLRVAIDGTPVTAIVDGLEPTEIPHATTMVDYLQVTLRYPTAGAPRQIDLRWTRWEGLPDEDMGQVPASVEGPRVKQEPLLSETDPGFSWFAADSPRRVLQLPDRPPPAAPTGDPDLARGLLLALLLSAAAFAVGGASRTLWLPTLSALALAAAIASGQALDEGPPPEPPTAPRAATIAEALVRNVYRSFEYTRESDVYDALARSVAGPLLDRVYRDVHAALVSREHGARARVTGVAFEAHEPLARAADELVLLSRWRVAGRVVHWGHEHARTLHTRARLTIRHLGDDGWRLVAVELLSQEATGD